MEHSLKKSLNFVCKGGSIGFDFLTGGNVVLQLVQNLDSFEMVKYVGEIFR